MGCWTNSRSVEPVKMQGGLVFGMLVYDQWVSNRSSEFGMNYFVGRKGGWIMRRAAIASLFLLGCLLGLQAKAEEVANPVATFAGLDKITARMIQFDVYIDETVQFGSLQVTPRVCYTRPETERQEETAFVEVDEITLERKVRRIFTGWMFASSPGMNAVEHPVYDVWLVGCKQNTDVPKPN